MRASLDREELIERLARTSHATWTRQKSRDGGVPIAELDPRVTHQDRERAEDVVLELEEIGLYSRRGRRRTLLDALRHPLVVGVGLALVSGVFASILVPVLTRVWQDRPKELALKQGLVKQISRAATESIDEGKFAALQRPRTAGAIVLYGRMTRRWEVKSSVVTAELTTYFHDTQVVRDWQAYESAVEAYLEAVAFRRISLTFGLPSVLDHFRKVRFSRGSDFESLRRHLLDPTAFNSPPLATVVPALLLAERDQLSRRLVETDASGFSHGWWIFR